MIGDCCALNSSDVVWTENTWCVFRVKPSFSNSSSVVWTRLSSELFCSFNVYLLSKQLEIASLLFYLVFFLVKVFDLLNKRRRLRVLEDGNQQVQVEYLFHLEWFVFQAVFLLILPLLLNTIFDACFAASSYIDLFSVLRHFITEHDSN